jgi:hypothetical protein
VNFSGDELPHELSARTIKLDIPEVSERAVRIDCATNKLDGKWQMVDNFDILMPILTCWSDPCSRYAEWRARTEESSR